MPHEITIPKPAKNVQLVVLVEPEQREAIRQVAESNAVSESAVVRHILRSFFSAPNISAHTIAEGEAA